MRVLVSQDHSKWEGAVTRTNGCLVLSNGVGNLGLLLGSGGMLYNFKRRLLLVRNKSHQG